MNTAGTSNTVKDPQLERQGRRIGAAGNRWLMVGAAACLPGIVLFVVGLVAGLAWMWAVGLAIFLIGGGPAVVGLALIGSSAVSRWSARRKSFA